MENQVVYTYQDLYKLTLNKNNILSRNSTSKSLDSQCIDFLVKPKYGNKFRTEDKIITINGINIKNVCNVKIENNSTYLTLYLLDNNNHHILGNLSLYNNQSLIESYNSMLDVYTYSIQTV